MKRRVLNLLTLLSLLLAAATALLGFRSYVHGHYFGMLQCELGPLLTGSS